ncbi:MAG: phosphoribosylamine--glycine ligase [Azospirillaceae bacterium]
MRLLLVGSGGREHALAWTLAASPLCDALFCAPGNPGIAADATCVDIAVDDIDGLVAFATRERIDFAVIGPEAPLIAGLVDRLEAAGVKAFGPTAAAARLEGSKRFTKDLCRRHGIPTADFGTFTDAGAAKAFIRERGAPIVVKADGPAAGKGVVVAATVAEAEAAVDAALVDGAFGASGAEVVVEECLIGPEASVFALVDGRAVLPLASAHDYKRAFDGDEGPNTGGMGAVSPTPRLDPGTEDRIRREILEPTVAAMAGEGAPFRGVLYAGVILTADGPKLLEYNVRFGDPECQALALRLMSDLLPALVAARDGVLKDMDLRWYPEPAVCLVLAADGYPGPYAKGGAISGLEEAAAVGECAADGPGEVMIFHAGTASDADGRLVANGGRVLNVCATGETVDAARRRAYATAAAVRWADARWRGDVGV